MKWLKTVFRKPKKKRAVLSPEDIRTIENAINAVYHRGDESTRVGIDGAVIWEGKYVGRATIGEDKTEVIFQSAQSLDFISVTIKVRR